MSDAEFKARFYPGDRPLAEEVTAQVSGSAGMLTVRGAGYSQTYSLADLVVEERLGDTPRIVELPNGGRLESTDFAALDVLEQALGGKRRWLHALESTRGPVVGSVVAVALLVVAFVWQGLPTLAWVGAQVVPPSYDQRIGQVTLRFLDRELLGPSQLTAADQARISALFDGVAQQVGEAQRPYLLFRSGENEDGERGLGPNALALPSGIVIITDELVALAENDDEILAVLAHEVGHVEHRHSLRGILQSAGITVLVGLLTGDAAGMNVIVESAPAAFANAAYSRRFETEADDFASRYMSEAGRDPGALGSLLMRLEAEIGAPDLGYLSTHPPARDRAERATEDTP
ncbi:MAG: M48 family metallopeptidase [Pseudomonadota bacterium]